MEGKIHKVGWGVMIIGALALIIVPFMIWGERIDAWTEGFIDASRDRPLIAGSVLGGLLASDILFPVPSSIVSTGCGVMLGLLLGTLVSLVGMVISCAIGYWLGRLCGRPAAVRLCGERDMERFAEVSSRFGLWALVIARPVPVLAEVSVLFAGVSRMPFGRFMLITSLSNLGVSAVYAGIGAYAADINSFLVAFLAGVCLPGLIMLAARCLR